VVVWRQACKNLSLMKEFDWTSDVGSWFSNDSGNAFSISRIFKGFQNFFLYTYGVIFFHIHKVSFYDLA